jgi:hypothetical protein
MHGPTCTFWANLTPLSLKPPIGAADALVIATMAPPLIYVHGVNGHGP